MAQQINFSLLRKIYRELSKMCSLFYIFIMYIFLSCKINPHTFLDQLVLLRLESDIFTGCTVLCVLFNIPITLSWGIPSEFEESGVAIRSVDSYASSIKRMTLDYHWDRVNITVKEGCRPYTMWNTASLEGKKYAI